MSISEYLTPRDSIESILAIPILDSIQNIGKII